MTTSNTDKVLGLAFAAAVSCSFVVTSEVSAETVFPPRHHDVNTVFSETSQPSSTRVDAPWYRANAGTVRTEIRFSSEDPRVGYVLAERSIGPWYRATN